MPDNAAHWLSLRSSALSARIDPLGAQLSQLQDAQGRDLLWNGDPAFWIGRAPLLFPIVGALAEGHLLWHGKRYAVPRHGFARNKPFEVVEARADTALLRLVADDRSLDMYPFQFVLQARFSLIVSTLSLQVSVGNAGSEAMPASFGFHPAFLWPLPYGHDRAAHSVHFETDEPEPIRQLNAQGLVEPELVTTPVRRRSLALTDDLFVHDALIFDRVRSRSVSFGAQSGPRIRVGFSNTPYLGIWSKKGAPFVCIEPWHGIADPEGFTGEFDAKPGVFIVAPGDVWTTGVDITLTND